MSEPGCEFDTLCLLDLSGAGGLPVGNLLILRERTKGSLTPEPGCVLWPV